MNNCSSAKLGVRDVIGQGFCIGCGACTVAGNDTKITFNPFGELVATLGNPSAEELIEMDKACPFSTESASESTLAGIAFANESSVRIGGEVGFYTDLYAGFSESHRKWGASGGIVTWLLSKLLSDGTVDKVIVVGRSNKNDRFFDFKAIGNAEELQATGTSFYYPVSYDRALEFILTNPGRYAITGVPCFHKALRQLKLVNPLIAERVVMQVGIVCGQMKSSFYLEYLDRKAGKTAPLVDACFRRKDETSRADDYLFEGSYVATDGVLKTRSVRNKVIGSNWAMGLFKPRACDFCDDVFAETADIAVMDAWLDQYVDDGKGTSLVIARTSALKEMLDQGNATRELKLASVSEDQVVESQRGGLNHRRVGLRYRLFLASKLGAVPIKRVNPTNQIDMWFKAEQRIRTAMRAKSRVAMRKQLSSDKDDLTVFDRDMRGILWLYKWFLRLKNRLPNRPDYRPKFKLDI